MYKNINMLQRFYIENNSFFVYDLEYYIFKKFYYINILVFL